MIYNVRDLKLVHDLISKGYLDNEDIELLEYDDRGWVLRTNRHVPYLFETVPHNHFRASNTDNALADVLRDIANQVYKGELDPDKVINMRLRKSGDSVYVEWSN